MMTAQFSDLVKHGGRLVAMFLLIWLGPGVAAPSNSDSKKCSLYGSEDKSRGQAVIFGRKYDVPELHLRYVDQATGKPISPKRVHVHYYWEWLEYPYQEHPWGAWSDAGDWVQCANEGESETTVPAFTVKPRGWYAGKYTRFPFEKKPRFDRIEIVIELEKYAPRVTVKSSKLSRYRNATALVKLSCGEPEKVTFEPRHGGSL